MALTKVKKAEKVSALAKDLENSTSAIIGTFSALTASKDFDLRKTVRAGGIGLEAHGCLQPGRAAADFGADETRRRQ